MASVKPFRNPSGDIVWRVQYRDHGKSRQETFRGDEAEESAHEFADLMERFDVKTAREVLARRTATTSASPTLREFTERYLDEQSGLVTGITVRTRIDYIRVAKSFLPLLGDLPIDTITKADIGRWVAWQEAQPARYGTGRVAAKTVKNHHALLSAILRAAVDQGLRPDNPAARAKLSRGIHREGVFLSSEEFDTLLRFIPDEHRPLVVFLAGTGCRWGEATALRWGDLNTKATPPTVRIERAWKRTGHGAVELGPPKSPKSRRTVSLPPEVLAELPERGKPADLIFTAPRGGMVWHGRFNADVWRPAVAAANDVERCAELGVQPIGKEPNIHDLRHTHASWLIAGGAPLPFVQARLGHEKIDTTVGTYGHLLPDAHVEMARIIGGAMQLSPKRALEASQARS